MSVKTARHPRQTDKPFLERDAAEEALSQAYYLVVGRSPEWSNLFGHAQALEEIDEACCVLRAAALSTATQEE